MTAEDEFADFVRARAPALYRYGFVLTGNAHDADDLVQEALIRLRGAWARVRDKQDPTGYVRTTMARLHINAWRRRRREEVVASVPEYAVEDGGYQRIDAYAAAWQALATLPPRQRAVIVLRYYNGLADEEIAESLDISRGTVRSQAARALEKLRAATGLIGEVQS